MYSLNVAIRIPDAVLTSAHAKLVSHVHANGMRIPVSRCATALQQLCNSCERQTTRRANWSAEGLKMKVSDNAYVLGESS